MLTQSKRDEEGEDGRAGGGGGEKGLDHLKVFQPQLSEDDGGLEDARGGECGAKRGAGDEVVHGAVRVGMSMALGVCSGNCRQPWGWDKECLFNIPRHSKARARHKGCRHGAAVFLIPWPA